MHKCGLSTLQGDPCEEARTETKEKSRSQKERMEILVNKTEFVRLNYLVFQ